MSLVRRFFEWLSDLVDPPDDGRTGHARSSSGWADPKGKGNQDSYSQESPAFAPPEMKPLDLDPGDFAPLSKEEFDAESRGSRAAVRGAWFHRRDRIPPADDPAARLIERAMVGQGMITPDELVHIHEVGAQMDAVAPTLELARVVADRALAADDAARAARKAEKKAEAAERRRRHAEAVAQRRATDIVFLGRGVSAGLAERESDPEALGRHDLPLLHDPADVSAALGIEVPQLRWLAFHSRAPRRTHYVRFEVAKKSGGTRELWAPMPALAAAQEWVLRELLDRVPVHDAAHGFRTGRSTLTNARAHVGQDLVVNLDLVDFFPTITFPRVKGVFRQLGYSPAVATVLALLCTEAPRRRVRYAGTERWVARGPRALPQGACTSPALSNLVARRLDARLTGIADKLGWTYTRYADDLTFSCPPEAADKVGYLMARIRHIAQDEGFAVNEAKTRVQRRSARQSVTGIVVNDRPGVPRETVRRLRAILHRAKTEGLAAQNREGHPDFEAWVKGMVAYVAMVSPEKGERLRAALEALDAA